MVGGTERTRHVIPSTTTQLALTLNVEMVDQSEDRMFQVESANIFSTVRQAQRGDSQCDALSVSSNRDPGVSHHFEGVGTDHLAMSTLNTEPSQ